MRPRAIVSALAMVMVLGLVGGARAQGLAPLVVGGESYFTVEWNAVERKGQPHVEGYVRNESGFGMMRVQVLVDALDAGGRIVGQRIEWVPGGLTPGSRAYFITRAPAAGATYRVRIFAFDMVQTASSSMP